MLPEEARAQETREWLHKASRDLRAGELDLTPVPPFTGDVMFHAQQLAEKALKAFLAWHDEPFRKTHDLDEVGMKCVAFDPTLTPVVKRAAGLSDYAWKYRYPGEPVEPREEDARDALAVAREVYEAILSRLPNEVRPT